VLVPVKEKETLVIGSILPNFSRAMFPVKIKLETERGIFLPNRRLLSLPDKVKDAGPATNVKELAVPTLKEAGLKELLLKTPAISPPYCSRLKAIFFIIDPYT
jgi:hypothetical protein